MMNYSELENWVLEQGGPSFKLRIHNRNEDKSQIDIEKTVSMLLKLDEVNIALDFLDAFKIQLRDKKTIEHLVHFYKDTCIDNFFGRLISLGFRAGIPIFDIKFQPVIKLFLDLLSEDKDYCYYYALMLHRFFFIAGYTHQAIIESMIQRMNAIHKSAKERIFDIYQDGSNLPKAPKQWLDYGVLKDDLNPFSKEARKPLPTIYDISALAYFPDEYKNSEIQKKIDDIVEYILDPEFQKIPEYYGLLWDKSKRRYYACGWGPALPFYENFDRPKHISVYSILNYLSIMSNFKAARKSKWYINCLNYVEQFRTEKGTYIFPKEYLDGKNSCPGSISNVLIINVKPDEAFLSETNMKLKRNEREILIRELVSTLNMIEINKKSSDL